MENFLKLWNSKIPGIFQAINLKKKEKKNSPYKLDVPEWWTATA